MTAIQKIKEELKKISEMFSSSEPEIKVSEMVVGGKVEMVNTDDSLSDAPDGEYTVDKDVIVVKDGQIVSINGETETKPVEEEQAADDVPTEDPAKEDNSMAELKAEVDALKAETETLKAAVEELKGAMVKDEAMSAEFTAQLNTLNETMKAIAVMPAEFSKTSTNTVVKDSKDDKIKAYAKILASNKK